LHKVIIMHGCLKHWETRT